MAAATVTEQPTTGQPATEQPSPDELNRYARERWDEEGADRWACDVPITDPGPLRTRLSILRPIPINEESTDA